MFKKGDLIRCIDPTLWLQKDALYIVSNYGPIRDEDELHGDEDFVFLHSVDHKQNGFWSKRFELVEEAAYVEYKGPNRYIEEALF